MRSWIEAYQRNQAIPPFGERRPFRRRYIVFLFAALLVLIGFATLLWRDWSVIQATGTRVVELREAVLQQDQFLALLVNAETGERGYLLTGDSGYLQPYLDAVAAYPRMRSSLYTTPRNLLSADEVRRMTQLSDQEMANLREAVRLAGQGQRELAIRLIGVVRGPGTMGEFRALGGRIRARQFQALVAGNLESRRWLANAAALQLIGALALVILLLLALIDISHAGRARDRSLAEVTRMNEELIQVSSVASHDLKEPLRTIVNFTQLLERRFVGRVLDNTASDYLDVVRTSAMRSYRLVDALQRFSLPLQTAPAGNVVARADTALRNVLQSLRAKIVETGAEVVAPDLAAVVRLDSGLLEQIFQNLLENAMKYRSQAPPRIEVRAHLENLTWVFTVRDNGIGFDPLFCERVFGLFQRLHEDQYPGVGLGLATCKKIVESTGGRIWAESKPGEGSAFHFTLPVGQRGERRPGGGVAAEAHA